MRLPLALPLMTSLAISTLLLLLLLLVVPLLSVQEPGNGVTRGRASSLVGAVGWRDGFDSWIGGGVTRGDDLRDASDLSLVAVNE